MPLTPLIERICSLKGDGPLRIGIDGLSASGKSTLSRRLAEALRSSGRTVHVVAIDGFHHPREHRHRQGKDSLQGYLDDSFQFDAVLEHVLMPLRPGGNRQILPAIFDHERNTPVDADTIAVGEGDVLLFEGVFAHHPLLRSEWDFTIYVSAEADEILRRGGARDARKLGGADVVRDRYLKRYLPGQSHFRDRHRTEDRADVVVYNDDPDLPTLVFKN